MQDKKKVLERDGGNGCTAMWANLKPPDYTLNYHKNDEFYVYFPQLKRNNRIVFSNGFD